MSAVAECYATPSTPFGETGPFYDSGGHRGQDYRRAAGQTVVAYEPGTVLYVGRTAGLGAVVGVANDAGGFAGWAHLANIPVGLGHRVNAGDVIGYVASAAQQPGQLWSGPHIHTTRSNVSALNAALGVRPLVDPDPYISAAKSRPAGTPGKPIDTDEDNMSKTQYFQASDNGGLSVSVGKGDWWCRESASAPLRRLTQPQVESAFAAEGIASGPFNFPNVFTRSGEWFIQAFKDDAEAERYSVDLTHPYLQK